MALSTFFFVLASSYVTFAALLEECPPKESTTCVCHLNHGIGNDIYCYGPQKTLQDNLKALRGYSIKSLNLERVSTSAMPTDLFQGLHVKNLYLFDFDVDDTSSLSKRYEFLGLENSLEVLRIAYSFQKTGLFLNLKLDHLHSLKEVNLRGNKIPQIGNDWFSNGPQNLEQFDAHGNGIEKLGDKAFASLKNLRYLRLGNNHLTEISRSILPSPAIYLHFLELSHNKIRTLPIDFFSEMPALDTVYLNSNLIQTLPEDTWSSVLSKLHYLDFYDNPLQCDQNLKWICKEHFDPILAQCTSPIDKKGRNMQQFCSIFNTHHSKED